MAQLTNNVNPRYNQGDMNTDQLSVTLSHNNSKMDLTTATAILLVFKKQDSSICVQDLNNGVTIKDAANGKIDIALNGETRSVAGTVTVEAHVTFPNNQVIVTEKFTFEVEDTLLIGVPGQANNNFQVLTIINVVSSVNLLPTPSVNYRMLLYAVEGGAGAADAIYICKKLSDDTYDWIQYA